MQTSSIPLKSLRFSLAIGFFLASVIPLFSQSEADSLIQELPSLKGEERVDVLSELCWLLTASDPTQAAQYGRQALSLADKIDYHKGKAQAYNDLGILQIYAPNLDSALWYFDHSLEIRKEIGDKEGIAAIYNKKGIVYKYRGLLEKAIENFLQTIQYYTDLNMTLELGMSYNNVAACYTDLKEYEKSLEFYQKALAIKRKTNNLSEIGGTLANIGSMQYELGQYAQAKATYQEALDMLKKSGDNRYLGQVYNGLAAVANEEGNYQTALDYYQRAFEVSQSTNNQVLFVSTRIQQSTLLVQLGRWQEAEHYLQEALKIAEAENMRLDLEKIYGQLVKLYAQQNQYQKAYQYTQQLMAIRDTLYDQDRAKLIAEMQTKFETQQKEQENQLLAAENQITALELKQAKRKNREQIYLSGGLGVLLILGGAVGYNRYRLRMQKRHTEEQKHWFQAVVEAEDKERKRIAMELHDGLGQILSTARLNVQCLDTTVKQAEPEEQSNYNTALKLIDDSCEEVRNISHNLMPGALTKMGLEAALNDLTNQVNRARQVELKTEIDLEKGSLTEAQEIMIYRIIQELINNSLKHSEASQIQLTIAEDAGQLKVTVKDNGKGTHIARLKESAGIGWKNLNSRITLLNGHLTVNTAPGKGTAYHIQVPMQTKTYADIQ